MSKIMSSLALVVCLITPTVQMYAQDHHDPPAHVWNDGENDHWHQYLKAQHRKDHEWAKASKKEQEAYWKWRDQHHDH